MDVTIAKKLEELRNLVDTLRAEAENMTDDQLQEALTDVGFAASKVHAASENDTNKKSIRSEVNDLLNKASNIVNAQIQENKLRKITTESIRCNTNKNTGPKI